MAVAAAGGASVERVAWVSDGDTIVLTNRAHVRLLQIDTPEVGSGECYSRAAARELRRLLLVGSAVRLGADPRLDGVDRYGRQLRYVWRRGMNMNVELLRRGAALVVERRARQVRSRLVAAKSRGSAAALGHAVWKPYAAAHLSRSRDWIPRRERGVDLEKSGTCLV
jgi:endonuclease YncB( thermonuclease family)